jgi:hypothetical protein
MGCFDMYCIKCGCPFNSFNPKYYPEMTGIDTTWLDDAVVEYYESNLKVNVSNYDSYGRFTDKDGVEHDVIEDNYNGKVKVCHKLCDEKSPKHKFTCNDQHFPIEKIIKQNKHVHLDKSQMF